MYKNFGAPFARAVKEADFTFIPMVGPGRTKGAKFPSVVLESGWSESATRLREDARLWQEGSAGAVRVVLQIKFYGRNRDNKICLVLFISRAHPNGQRASLETYVSFLQTLNTGDLFTHIFVASSVPNRPGRPTGPWSLIVPGIPGRVDKDGRAWRPSLINMAVLGVDGRALQSWCN